jgi:methyl-accepting chemotaxis protein
MSRLWKAIWQPRLSVRLQHIAATALICLLILGGLAVNENYNVMLDARVDKLRAITEQAVSIAAELERQVEAGKLNRDQAIQQFRDAIRPIRYDGGAGYFYAYGMNGKTLVLGPTPQAEGTNRMGIKDVDGLPFVQALAQVAEHGGGTVTFRYAKPARRRLNPSSDTLRQFRTGTCSSARGCMLTTCGQQPWLV